MRCIDDHCSGVCCDLLFQLFQIRLEGSSIRRDFHKLSVKILYICTILQEIRCKNNHFFPRIQDRFQDDVQSACSTHCHDQVLCRKGSSETAVQRFRNRLTHIFKTGIAHISVKNGRLHFIDKVNDCLTNTVRCRNTWISKAEVEYFVGAVNAAKTISFLKHHTNR